MPNYNLNIIVTAKDQASGILGGLGKALGGVGQVAAGVLGAMGIQKLASEAGRALASTVNVAKDFESQMSVLAIAASGSGESFQTLHDAAIAVGGDISLIGVSASGAGDAMTGLYKAGLTTTEIFGDLQGYLAGTADLGGALRASIDLAAATELDMVQASDLAAIALATFGGELKTEAERAEFVNMAMNNMVQAADASVASVSDLAEGMKNIGSTAAAFGFQFADVNNALALLSTRGIAGAEAGTALKSMLTNMMRDTKDVSGTWKTLGISLYDASGNMKALPQIIGELSGAMAGMTSEQRNSIVQTLAGTYGMKAMNTLLAEGEDGWDAMAEATAAAAGIQTQAAAKAKTFAGAQEALAGAFETLKIQIGEAVLPVLTDLVRWATGMIDTYGPGVMRVVDSIASTFSGLSHYLSAVLEDGDYLNDWLTNLPPAIQPVVELLGRLLSGDLSFSSLLPPEVLGIWTSFQGMLDQLGAWWEEYGPGIQAKAAEMFGLIQQAGAELASKVLPWISEKLEQFGAWFTENGPLISDFAQVVMEAFTRVWQEVLAAWEWIEPVLNLLIDLILDIAKIIMQMVTGDWAGAWQTAQDLVSNAWENIKELWVNFANWVTGWFGTTWQAVVDMWATNWEMFKVIVVAVWDAITGTLQGAGEGIKTFLSNTWESIRAAALILWEGIKATIMGRIEALFAQFGLSMDEMLASWAAIWEEVKEIAAELWRRIATFWSEILTKVAGAVTTFFVDLYGKWKAGWQQVQDWLSEVLSALLTAVVTRFLDIYTAITEKIGEILSWLGGIVGQFVGAGAAIVDGLIEGIKSKAGDMIKAATGGIKDALDAAKRLLGIGSPSRLAAREIGAPLMAGIAKGIIGSATIPTLALDTAIGGMMNAASGSAGSSSTSNNWNTKTIHYNLNLTTQQQSRGIIMDFATLRAMGG